MAAAPAPPNVARMTGQPVTAQPVTAQSLFAPIGPTYDRVGAALSFGQDPRWRRFLVSRLPSGSHANDGHVLDVATGTGLVAAELRRRGFVVTGVDQSPEMLAVARRRFGGTVDLIHASAEALPFESGSFDHLTFTYLLRYTADPAATLAELARVVRPGGYVASLEFGVPRGVARPFWDLYVRTALPLAGRVLRHGWREVGDFLGGSIRDFWWRYPLGRQLEWWRAAGLTSIHVRPLSFGAAVVIWGRKPGTRPRVSREAS
jgi:demethylmenaquinone methyltransferase / 2-methoxy-6-polyprenyl-1,4-benzoquinol methylase